jgi:LysM repeat protein
MIPLNATNFSQANSKGVPVYYTVGEKEGLYRVSLKNNKVLMANLRKWNKLANDNITTGQKLIIGYLNTTETPPTEIARVEPPVRMEDKKENPRPTAPVVETKQETAPEPQTNATTNAPSVTPSGKASGAGYFKTQFDLQSQKNAANKEQTLTTGIFKTSSGWQDSKYYALMDNLEPGTIIRVVNPSNNKFIYAKILGEMSGIRQNQGLELRLSNAAASALEVSQMDKFTVRVNY